MVKIDRSKYRKSDAKELKKVSDEMKEREASSRGGFIKIETGINQIRIFPAPIKAKSSLFLFPKVTSFLPMMVDAVDDNGNKTGKQEKKRKAVFNAKVHGNFERDIVEEYMQAVRDKYTATIKDKKELLNKLKPLSDWKTGIKPTSSWIVYAYKKVGDKKIYGRLQLTDGVKKQMDTLCLRQGETGSPIVVDLFSDPDKGKMIQWVSNPNSEDAKSRNKVSILFEEDSILTDEELEMLESWDSLESLYTNSFTKSDFEKQLKGLELYDKDNKLNVFSTSSFQSIIESCKEEIDSKLGDDDNDEDADDSEENNSTSKSENEEDTIPAILEEMDKKTLKDTVELLELNIEVKATIPPSKLRTMIKDSIIESYELEGSDEEINSSISDIIENAFNDEESQENNEEKPSEENNEEESSEKNNEEAEEKVEEKEEEEKPKSKKSSLLDKYKKRAK